MGFIDPDVSQGLIMRHWKLKIVTQGDPGTALEGAIYLSIRYLGI